MKFTNQETVCNTNTMKTNQHFNVFLYRNFSDSRSIIDKFLPTMHFLYTENRGLFYVNQFGVRMQRAKENFKRCNFSSISNGNIFKRPLGMIEAEGTNLIWYLMLQKNEN